jgi:hypothetical protein
MDTEAWNSQAWQDQFVAAALPREFGVFVDIGAGHPFDGSNTAYLERERGWSGLLCDRQWAHELARCRETRNMVFSDALDVEWSKVLPRLARDGWIDYLSLDLEPPILTLQVLASLPLRDVRFKVATIEHDLYRGNESIRAAMRGIMFGWGYELVAADVCCVVGDRASPFEDWWAAPEYAEAARAAVASVQPVTVEGVLNAKRQAEV